MTIVRIFIAYLISPALRR